MRKIRSRDPVLSDPGMVKKRMFCVVMHDSMDVLSPASYSRKGVEGEKGKQTRLGMIDAATGNFEETLRRVCLSTVCPLGNYPGLLKQCCLASENELACSPKRYSYAVLHLCKPALKVQSPTNPQHKGTIAAQQEGPYPEGIN
jgi:hypothetical protein